MSPTPAAPTPTTAPPQQDAKGRFVNGNRGGPGNPYARQCAAFRQAIHDAVTVEDFRALAADLLVMARSGNLAAMKLLFAYAIGKPAAAPDPDRVDVDEWKLLQDSIVGPQDGFEAGRGVPVEFANEFLPIIVECDRRRVAEQLSAGLAEMDERDRQEAAAAAQEEDRPLTNEATGEAPAPRPSPAPPAAPRRNGGNGPRPPAAAPAVVAEERAPMGNGANGCREPQDNVSPEAAARLIAALLGELAANHQEPPLPNGVQPAPAPAGG